MLFTDLAYFFFFPMAFFVHWTLPKQSLRKLWLLSLSYIFYAAWDWRFLSLIILSTAFDFVAGRQIYQSEKESRRRNWFLGSLFLNLGMLAIFKYFNFFVDSLNQLFISFGSESSISNLNIILPVGISFYTFQTLSYTIDIYRRQLRPTKSLLDFSLFVAFFPQLVAGPIVRAIDFLKQLDSPRCWNSIDVRGCLVLFASGFFKKACVSDNLSPYIDAFYQSPTGYDVFSTYLMVVAYSIQIYCDFSAYTEMAIASAGLLGYRLCNNFNFPYFATNIGDFWRRWHISLSTWLRDYLFITLGGSRGTRWLSYRNLMLTMLLGGLWHGASWNFVLWGGLHGFALIALRVWTEMRSSASKKGSNETLTSTPSKWMAANGQLLTFMLVCLAWIPFRASSFADTMVVLGNLIGHTSPSSVTIAGERTFILVVALSCLMLCHRHNYVSNEKRKVWRNLPPFAFALLYGFLWSFLLASRSMQSTPFIYFQF
ncbi:Peptidoglycan O-acetyltransferase [Rubripirellula obstinata]|uniref:Peptidoglycan O-acetyltransferase n=1 Tax=Rubripirellula obstinata TaxID=406547 RepID=A0A5B1CGZ2_9BACT|nr:MBOAT family O-acyltransferase [Rubripirellula obstinata]KAA1259826.1 Peptidoglycan O-acetyltransferase [Rubripirellula obstinata]